MAKRLLLPAALLLVLPAFLFAQVGTSGQTGSPHVALISTAPQTQVVPRVAAPAPRVMVVPRVTPAPRVRPAPRVTPAPRINPYIGRGVTSQHELQEARERAAHRAEEFAEHRVIPAYPYFVPYGYYSYYDPFYYPGYYTGFAPGYWNYTYGPMSDYSGHVHIKDAPKDAAVFVNGSYAGTVRELKHFNLEPGRYTIEVRMGDRDIAEESVYVVAGRTIDIHARG